MGEESFRPIIMVVDEMPVFMMSPRGTECCLSHLIRRLVRRIHVSQGSNASIILCLWRNLLRPFPSSTVDAWTSGDGLLNLWNICTHTIHEMPRVEYNASVLFPPRLNSSNYASFSYIIRRERVIHRYPTDAHLPRSLPDTSLHGILIHARPPQNGP